MYPGEEPNGYVFLVSDEQKNETGLDETTKGIADKIADLMSLKKEVLFDYLTGGFYKITIGKKGEVEKKLEVIDKDILEKILSIDPLGKITMTDTNEIEYRGDLNWHQLTGKMLKKGFEQDPEFDRISGSNSYESKTDVKEESKECSHDNCGCSDEEKSSENTEFKSKKIQSFDVPTNIVILGADHNGRDIEITDDFSSLDFYIGGKKVEGDLKYFETEGHVSILTLDKYKEWIEENKDNGVFDAVNALFLPGFKGDIGIGVKTDDGKFTCDFDHESYILHQDKFQDEYPDCVFISLPNGTTTQLIKDHDLNTIISHLRDVSIDKIVQK